MFGYSFDEEVFYGNCETREEALEEGMEEYHEYGTIYTGRLVEYRASEFVPPVDRMLDDMADNACERVGDEVVDVWLFNLPPDVKRELADSIKRLVDEWATKHNLHPRFHGVEDVQAHESEGPAVEEFTPGTPKTELE